MKCEERRAGSEDSNGRSRTKQFPTRDVGELSLERNVLSQRKAVFTAECSFTAEGHCGAA